MDSEEIYRTSQRLGFGGEPREDFRASTIDYYPVLG